MSKGKWRVAGVVMLGINLWTISTTPVGASIAFGLLGAISALLVIVFAE